METDKDISGRLLLEGKITVKYQTISFDRRLRLREMNVLRKYYKKTPGLPWTDIRDI